MNFPLRLGLAIAVLGAFGATLTWLNASGTTGPAPAGAVRWESAQQCKQCHADVFAEWSGSHHAIAYTNPEVRKLSEDFRKEECMDCHLPRPLAFTGFGSRTLPRRTHFDEGISCISCHLGPDGGLVGRNDRPEVPCKPQRDEQFLAVDACMACHNQHGTTDQWRASTYAAEGVTCAACHMPEVERKRGDKSTRMGRKHVYEGCHDLAMLKKAGRFAVRRVGDEVELALTNVGAGHNFPTEERHRAVDLMYRFVGKDGSPAADWQLAWRFRMPYRDDPEPVCKGAEPAENTQLPAGQTKALRVPIPEGMAAVETRMWYRLTPYVGDDDPMSTLLEEVRLDL